MRLIYSTSDPKQGTSISALLTSEGIENQLEISTNTDWGSEGYGDIKCIIWVNDEDKTTAAQQWIEAYEKDPQNPIFQRGIAAAVATPIDTNEELQEKVRAIQTPQGKKMATISLSKRNITFYIILICTIVFIIDVNTEPQIKTNAQAESIKASGLPTMPLLASPIKKTMLFDYPLAYEFLDKFVRLYGFDKLNEPQELPKEGQYILTEFHKTPYWQGEYGILLEQLKKPEDVPTASTVPLFEKIRQGEFWRLFTPALLHNDILHLLFNMLWLIVLGQQMEQRLGTFRYILFALLVGIFSNTCQYLMSGPNFIGYSGILCGLLTFIWMRQKIAAWEGYPLQKSTITFMMFFIFSMFAIQIFSFYLEIHHDLSIAPGIANTAHLSGAAFGAFLGRLPFFSWKG